AGREFEGYWLSQGSREAERIEYVSGAHDKALIGDVDPDGPAHAFEEEVCLGGEVGLIEVGSDRGGDRGRHVLTPFRACGALRWWRASVAESDVGRGARRPSRKEGFQRRSRRG